MCRGRATRTLKKALEEADAAGVGVDVDDQGVGDDLFLDRRRGGAGGFDDAVAGPGQYGRQPAAAGAVLVDEEDALRRLHGPLRGRGAASPQRRTRP
jgi:hypothetical protein